MTPVTIHDLPRTGYWYLATPYSKWPHGLDDAARVAEKLAARLLEERFPIFSPIAHSHSIAQHVVAAEKRDFDFWLGADKPLVDAAIGLLIADLTGWRESRGVVQEIKWGREQKKPIWILNTKSFSLKACRL